MTILNTRFHHPLYGDDVINLSITDILDTQYTGQIVTGLSSDDPKKALPFAFTEDLRLFILTTPRDGLDTHMDGLRRMSFHVACPTLTQDSRQVIRLTGDWKRVSERDYAEAVATMSRRFPSFETMLGSFATYEARPVRLHVLHAEQVLLRDAAMFGGEPLSLDVLRLRLPDVSLACASPCAVAMAAS